MSIWLNATFVGLFVSITISETILQNYAYGLTK
jgi:hypothetical protein